MDHKTMTKRRNYYTYEQKTGNKVNHRGITNDLDRREQEHQEQFPGSHIKQVGIAKTKEGALEWERRQDKTITPSRRK